MKLQYDSSTIDSVKELVVSIRAGAIAMRHDVTTATTDNIVAYTYQIAELLQDCKIIRGKK